jgi:hypothetical protein
MNCVYLAQIKDEWHVQGEHGIEHSCCIECWEIIEYLSDWRLLLEDRLHRISHDQGDVTSSRPCFINF